MKQYKTPFYKTTFYKTMTKEQANGSRFQQATGWGAIFETSKGNIIEIIFEKTGNDWTATERTTGLLTVIGEKTRAEAFAKFTQKFIDDVEKATNNASAKKLANQLADYILTH